MITKEELEKQGFYCINIRGLDLKKIGHNLNSICQYSKEIRIYREDVLDSKEIAEPNPNLYHLFTRD